MQSDALPARSQSPLVASEPVVSICPHVLSRATRHDEHGTHDGLATLRPAAIMTDRGCASPDHPSLAARVLVRRATRDAHPFLCADVVRSARRELSASCLASAAAICSCRLREPLATRRAHLLRPCDGQRDPAALDRARCRALVALCGISLVVTGGITSTATYASCGAVLCMGAGLVSIRHESPVVVE